MSEVGGSSVRRSSLVSRGSMASRGGMSSRGHSDSALSGLLSDSGEDGEEAGTGPRRRQRGGGKPRHRRRSLIEVIEDSGGKLDVEALLPPITKPRPRQLKLSTSTSRSKRAILPTGWDATGEKKVDSKAAEAAEEDATTKEDWARRRQARKAYALWEMQKKADAEKDYRKRMVRIQQMHEDDPDWDQEEAAAQLEAGAEAAGIEAVEKLTGAGGILDVSAANGSKSMAFMGIMAKAVTKFKIAGRRRSHQDWLEAKQEEEETEMSNLWAQAEAEIEAEDADDFASANSHERFVQEKMAQMRVDRQNLKARVLQESSQIVGGISRPSSAIQEQHRAEEVIRPTEDQQYSLGVDVMAVLDRLDRIAPGSQDASYGRHRLVGVPNKLPPKPTRDMVGKKPRY